MIFPSVLLADDPSQNGPFWTDPPVIIFGILGIAYIIVPLVTYALFILYSWCWGEYQYSSSPSRSPPTHQFSPACASTSAHTSALLPSSTPPPSEICIKIEFTG